MVSPLLRLIAKILTFILYGVTALSCYGGHLSPAVTPLGSVLTIAMPYLVSLSAAVIIVWFCMRRWITASLGILMFIACAAPIRTWFPLNHSRQPSPGAFTFTILTWNTLHFADLENPGSTGCRTLAEILRVDADIVCLQEIFGFEKRHMKTYDQALVDSLMKRYPYQLGAGSYDLSILSKYPIRHAYFGSVYRYRLAEYFTVDFPGRRIGMADIHLPSFSLNGTEQEIFSTDKNGLHGKEELGKSILRKLRRAIPIRAEAAEKVIEGFRPFSMPVIVVGDFNDVPSSWTYRLFTEAGFKDAYTATNFWPTYTFYPHGLYFHLDQIFYRGDVRPLSVERLDIRTSDHLPLLATFEILPEACEVK